MYYFVVCYETIIVDNIASYINDILRCKMPQYTAYNENHVKRFPRLPGTEESISYEVQCFISVARRV